MISIDSQAFVFSQAMCPLSGSPLPTLNAQPPDNPPAPGSHQEMEAPKGEGLEMDIHPERAESGTRVTEQRVELGCLSLNTGTLNTTLCCQCSPILL